ncbi:MAG TPA: FtsX-like permease family protein, partial [Chryseosolibacter sp.]
AGANNDTLIFQFLLESYFYVGMAMVLALAVVAICLLPFNYFSGKAIPFPWLVSREFVAGILIFILITGLVAGSYPAFYLTRFSPVDVMKGNLRARLRTYGIRNVLVVFQFFISASLIIATLVVYHQLKFIQTAHLGFDKSNVVNLLHTRNLRQNGPAFKRALLTKPAIISASYCNRLPPNVEQKSVFRPAGGTQDYLLNVYEMDCDHLRTMGYTMAAGRFFEDTDTDAVILNETAAAKLGIQDFKGRKLISNYHGFPERELEVIGIITDFNFQSLKDPIMPMAIVLGPQPNWEMAIRVKDSEADSAMAFIRKLWRQYASDAAFEYSFVEHNFDSKQAAEKQIGLLFMTFTLVAVIIGCLGLFGLATFTAEHNRKQIGIRKALGASPGDIVLLLNKDFLKLVLFANLIAAPLTGWIMHEWLNQFAYHTGTAWWIFALTAGITFIIAFVSISFMAFKAAAANPVDSLHYE